MFENSKNFFYQDLYDEIIGIDEVGRGSLCGPVVSCALILKKKIISETFVSEINDSKKLTEKRRQKLSILLKSFSSFSIGIATSKEIDQMNILNATILSMKRSYIKFKGLPNKVKIDGNKIFHLNNKTCFLIKGDQKSISIAAASIVAKTFRDNLMINLSKKYSKYGWEKNKGYGTKKHIEAIRTFGSTPLHRKKFISKIL